MEGRDNGVKISRRRWLKRALLGAGLAAPAGVYAVEVEPFWLELHELPMVVPGLGAGFEGFRLAHLSDLHAGRRMRMSYLKETLARVTALRPDVVLVTGDLVQADGDSRRWVAPVSARGAVSVCRSPSPRARAY